MEGATRFIEVVKLGNYTTRDYSNMIESLPQYLADTKQHIHIKTIAVWYIKPKINILCQQILKN